MFDAAIRPDYNPIFIGRGAGYIPHMAVLAFADVVVCQGGIEYSRAKGTNSGRSTLLTVG